jgi:two-component system, NarL family, response regulator NreC
VMDLNMPKLNGVDAIQQVRKLVPSTHVLVLSMHGGEEYVRPAIRAGASGYLLKGAGLTELVKAIRVVLDGEAFFSPAVAKILLRDARSAEICEEETMSESLTPREREVLQLLAEGLSSPQIARQLHISTKTVEAHRSRIMKRLDIHNIAGLVRYAIRIGLVSIDG